MSKLEKLGSILEGTGVSILGFFGGVYGTIPFHELGHYLTIKFLGGEVEYFNPLDYKIIVKKLPPTNTLPLVFAAGHIAKFLSSIL